MTTSWVFWDNRGVTVSCSASDIIAAVFQYSISDKKPINQEKKGKNTQPKEAAIDGQTTELGFPWTMLVTQHAKRESFQREWVLIRCKLQSGSD